MNNQHYYVHELHINDNPLSWGVAQQDLYSYMQKQKDNTSYQIGNMFVQIYFAGDIFVLSKTQEKAILDEVKIFIALYRIT